MTDTDKRVVLITGASSGIGKSVAKKLIHEDFTVYALSRRVEKMQDLESMGVYLLSIDVSDDNAVEAAISRVVSQESKIDVLFNNAGYGVFGTVENVPIDEIKRQFEVNLFGMARLIKAVLPHMRSRKKGLVINNASSLGHISIAGLGWYAATKHAVEAMSDALRMEVKDIGIDVVILEPGAVKTGFDTIAMENFEKFHYPNEYQKVLNGFRKYMTHLYNNCEDEENTARKVVGIIKSSHHKARYATTWDARVMINLRKFLSDNLYDLICFRLLR